MNGQSTGYLLLIRNEWYHSGLCLRFRFRMLIIYQPHVSAHIRDTYLDDYHVRGDDYAIPVVTLQTFLLHFRNLLNMFTS